MWYVRRASLHDRPELEALCRAAVGPDDYVIEHLEDLILRNVVHVALGSRQEVLGMMSYSLCLDGAAWLGQARTHPDVRRQGIARALIESFVGIARSSGVPALRLWSEGASKEGLGSAVSSGFREIGRYTRLVGSSASGARRAAPIRFDESAWRLAGESWIVARGHGYVSLGSTFVPVTRSVVFAMAAAGFLLGWGSNLLGVPATQRDGGRLRFTMLSGQPEELFQEACRQAATAGCENAETFLPRDRDLVSEARRAGFEPGSWGREAVLFELPVAAGNLRRRVRPTYGELAAKRSGHAHDNPGLGWARWNP